MYAPGGHASRIAHQVSRPQVFCRPPWSAKQEAQFSGAPVSVTASGAL